MVPMQPIKKPNDMKTFNNVRIELSEIYFQDDIDPNYISASAEVRFASPPISERIHGRGETWADAMDDLKKKIYEHAARYEIAFELAKHSNVEIVDRTLDNSSDPVHETEIRVSIGFADRIVFVATGRSADQALRQAYRLFERYYSSYHYNGTTDGTVKTVLL